MNDDDGKVVAAAAWADRETLVGAEFLSGWVQVSAEHVRRFDEASFVDLNAHGQEESIYPDGLVEGFHALSLLDHLVNQVSYLTDSRWSGWNYGLDRVRFVTPITTADRVRVRGRIASMVPRGRDVLVLYSCAVEVEGRSAPGVVAEWRVLWTLVAEADET